MTMTEQTNDGQTNDGQANDGVGREEWTDEPTGDGGSTGVASSGADRMAEQGETENATVISGGDVVDRDDLDPEDEAESTTSLD